MGMTNRVEAHHPRLKLDQPVPENVPVASHIKLKARVMCPLGCDLGGRPVCLMKGEEILATGSLVASHDDPAWSETEELLVKAPEWLGSSSWVLLFAGQE